MRSWLRLDQPQTPRFVDAGGAEVHGLVTILDVECEGYRFLCGLCTGRVVDAQAQLTSSYAHAVLARMIEMLRPLKADIAVAEVTDAAALDACFAHTIPVMRRRFMPACLVLCPDDGVKAAILRSLNTVGVVPDDDATVH